VSDTGIGIAPELQETIFQPFQQVDGSFTRQHSGLGLGLTISFHYCEMMGGTMGLHSEPGRGSTFTVSMPAEVTAVPSMYVRSSQPANVPTDA
jgi:signal transduction histidine kinase